MITTFASIEYTRTDSYHEKSIEQTRFDIIALDDLPGTDQQMVMEVCVYRPSTAGCIRYNIRSESIKLCSGKPFL